MNSRAGAFSPVFFIRVMANKYAELHVQCPVKSSQYTSKGKDGLKYG